MNNATIIIGLGNPGAKFQDTRHNVGFMAVDKFAEINNFPEFKLNKKFNAEVSEEILDEQKILLVKPKTFMNNSGIAVRSLTKPYPIDANPLIVIHDDIDLPVGKIKIVKERGSAGHKGVESIIKAIGNKNLIRIRIGIKPEQSCSPNHRIEKAEIIVLKKFLKEEQKIINQTIEKTAEALNFLIKNDLEKTMNEFNKQ